MSAIDKVILFISLLASRPEVHRVGSTVSENYIQVERGQDTDHCDEEHR